MIFVKKSAIIFRTSIIFSWKIHEFRWKIHHFVPEENRRVFFAELPGSSTEGGSGSEAQSWRSITARCLEGANERCDGSQGGGVPWDFPGAMEMVFCNQLVMYSWLLAGFCENPTQKWMILIEVCVYIYTHDFP